MPSGRQRSSARREAPVRTVTGPCTAVRMPPLRRLHRLGFDQSRAEGCGDRGKGGPPGPLMYRLDLSVEGSSGGADLPRRGSGLLIRGFGVQVPGGAPGLTWGFITPGHFFVPVLSAWLLRGCSRARTQQSGSCQKRPIRPPCGGMRPGAAPSRPAGAAPGSLDQWSRPLAQAPGAHPESSMPMPSRSVRPAGNRHSGGDTPLMPRARHAGCLPGMRWAAARRSRAAASPARLRPKQQVRWVFLSGNGAQNVRVRVTPCRPGMSTDLVQVYALQRRLQASAWTAAACGG
jgi:hypothetical protein